MRNDLLQSGTPFYCDLYHLTMAQAWFSDNKHMEQKTSEAFFRKCPFGGSYLVAAGLQEFVEWIENWHISQKDIDYLKTLKNADGLNLFNDDFLSFIKNQKLNLSINAVSEGEIVFSNEPVLSVSGPCWQVDMVEAAFLNIFNAQSLIATKASRMVNAASSDGIKRPVLEFGLRRAQDMGCFLPTRASYIGGCVGTSNVAAAQYYGIEAKGTMAHSFIMSYENEKDAFISYLKSSKGNTTLLVDTYDTKQGIKNAIKASEKTGIRLDGIRIDSGDLAYWSKLARKMLDDANMGHTKIVVSNDLDEYLIENLVMVQKAPIDIFAAGTKLVTAYDTPALGGVFKTKEYMSQPKIKIAENKTTIPGATKVVRIVKNGKYEGDIITRSSEELVYNQKLSRGVRSYKLNSATTENTYFEKGTDAYYLLKPVMINGQMVGQDLDLSLKQIRQETLRNLEKLDNSYKRLANSHIYGVGLEQNLFDLQQCLIAKHQER
ncbi:MAG: nicotinate phosphoribosyltransferase [Alphaproteobacteria bacterium]|nr:nicotinate phosphoribosyltransferase [Alphaproteobacteria bacterium]